MGNEHHQCGSELTAGASVQAEHPDPAASTGMISPRRAPFYGQVPPWPRYLIEPTDAELAHWIRLWRHPNAAEWIETEQEDGVARLVRLEQRALSRRRSAQADAELEPLRQELGLTD